MGKWQSGGWTILADYDDDVEIGLVDNGDWYFRVQASYISYYCFPYLTPYTVSYQTRQNVEPDSSNSTTYGQQRPLGTAGVR